jgi:hypothetical protein
MSQVPQGQLSLARQQARGGNIPGALATWRSMFNVASAPGILPPRACWRARLSWPCGTCDIFLALSRLAQHVQWQYAACRVGGGILPDHGQRQIALSAGHYGLRIERFVAGHGQVIFRRQPGRRRIAIEHAAPGRLFNGNTPPAGLAAEYYLTMASDKSLYPQAISELRGMLRHVLPQFANGLRIERFVAGHGQVIFRRQPGRARQQARGGNIPGALATWRSMFNGNTPPAGLAAEG